MTTVITSFSQPVLRGQSRPRTGFASTVLRALFLSIAMLAATSIAPRLARASDHGDTPLLKSIPRHDARMTDLYAFVRKDCSAFFCRKHLVLVATLDPTIPPDATTYRFAEDLTVRIAIDNAAEIAFDNPDDVRNFGGTIIQPDEIRERIEFEVRFSEDRTNQPMLRVTGIPRRFRHRIRFFAGLRDDPFIRLPREGRNIAAIVISVPLRLIVRSQPGLLIWATSEISDIEGQSADLLGRSLRSMFEENDAFNALHPSEHYDATGLSPDVMIYNTWAPATFPNGRELTDDVVDLVAALGDDRILQDDQPSPTINDRPFLDEFPYLAPPHQAGGHGDPHPARLDEIQDWQRDELR
ncbi:MAG: DUF4331 domain-containing protein [Proteobacteria bacterium]|nr:DUF4331 domain-containing protein [Pseudomonadota bacterium]